MYEKNLSWKHWLLMHIWQMLVRRRSHYLGRKGNVRLEQFTNRVWWKSLSKYCLTNEAECAYLNVTFIVFPLHVSQTRWVLTSDNGISHRFRLIKPKKRMFHWLIKTMQSSLFVFFCLVTLYRYECGIACQLKINYFTWPVEKSNGRLFTVLLSLFWLHIHLTWHAYWLR